MNKVEWHPDGCWAHRETADGDLCTLSGSPGWCLRCRKMCWLTNTWSARANAWLLDETACRAPPERRRGCLFCCKRTAAAPSLEGCGACTARVIAATRALEGAADDADETPFA